MRTRFKVLRTTAVIWLGAAGLIAFMVQPFVTPVQSATPQVDPALLEAHVKKLSVALYPRSFEQFDHLEAAAQYILGQLRASGASVTVQTVTVQEASYKNIIAHFGPANGPVVVVGAHYDSYGNAAAAGDARGFGPATHTPGADDNASGVAGLLELARLLGRTAPSRPVELVAYTLEEPPNFRSQNMGSAWHAAALKAARREVRLMLSLEMIGFFSDAPGSQSYSVPSMSHLYSDRGDFIALVGKFGAFQDTRRAKALMAGASDLPVYSINAPRMMPGIDLSDHRNYWDQGYPAMMITDTAFMRNPNYHHAGDTYEKLDYVRMAKVVKAAYAVVQQY